ncbi:uncharacterized protein A4U43_C08F24060 [Asparagus officinalis]|uniref:uncharacterized protein PHLOEM PROTEIN 2-LIKE A4-like isoform X2 n=1 Tax=Asparagus officinalis TaxID=4686 RepID=UPI00098E6ADC|nr:uncharacterized protein PHLOEM PROTEIN 2-LIKE A4-like isoform X2 [Asparagus officinalis]ONK60917.1 uncharacterized protein A4U43_C08F24060 [Asparagus officinalis]
MATNEKPDLHNSWIEEMSGEKGIILHPRELNVVGGDDETCWQWHSLVTESKGELGIEVPKLMGTKHVEVHGKWKMSKLTPGAKYQIAYLLFLKDPVEGWENCPLSMKLTLPDGTTQIEKLNLSKLPEDQVMLVVASYFDGVVDDGEITFSLIETSDVVKRGLIIRDVLIRPLPPMAVLSN